MEKKGILISGSMRKFINAYSVARQVELDALRAAELAKAMVRV